MKKVENASDVREFFYFSNMAEQIEETIRIRNQNGWYLLSTNAVSCGETMVRYFLYWERNGVKLVKNASDVEEFCSWEDMAEQIEETIRIRNQNDWHLISTDACESGEADTLYFLYWERLISQ